MAAPTYSVVADSSLVGTFDARPAAEAKFAECVQAKSFTEKLELHVSRVLASAEFGIVQKKSRPVTKQRKPRAKKAAEPVTA